MEKVYIFGHRNPDTDSVTAAITLSYLKNKLGMNTIPAVLSSINLESKFALNYFNVPEPIFLNDVNIKIKDLRYTKNYTVKEKDSIYEAYFRMNKVGISKIPVVDKDKNMIGILSMKDIAKDQFAFNYFSSIASTINYSHLNRSTINGTGDARKVIEKIKNKEVYYDFIEVMACEGGCISGGGQPRVFPLNKNLKNKRMNTLYKSDKRMKIRCASMNPDIKDIYDNFFGEVGSDISLKYLHTKHRNEE